MSSFEFDDRPPLEDGRITEVSSNIEFAQIWGSGFDWSEAPQAEEIDPPPSYKLHSPFNVGFATFWGGPAAGGFLMALNFWRTRRLPLALFVLVAGIIFTAALVSVAEDLHLYLHLPRLLIPLVGIVVMVASAKILQGQAVAWHFSRGGQMAPLRSAFGVGLVFLVFALIGLFGSNWELPGFSNPELGRKIDFGAGSEIYYAAGATEVDARKLRNCLQLTGYYSGNARSTIRISKNDDGFLIDFCVESWAFTDLKAIEDLKEIARQLSEDFAPGRPITVRLCDDMMKPQLTLSPVTGVASAPWRTAFNAGVEAQGKHHFDDAAKKFQEAVREAERFAPNDFRLAMSLYNQATALQNLRAISEASPLYQRALAVADKARLPKDSDITLYILSLADCLRIQHKYADAEPVARRAVELHEKKLGPKDARLADDLNLLGEICLKLGRFVEAETLFGRAKAIGDNSKDIAPAVKALTFSHLAHCRKLKSRFKDALDLYNQAVTAYEKAGDANEAELAGCLAELAGLDMMFDRFAEAEIHLKRSLTISQKAVGPGSPLAAFIHLELARLRCWQEKWDAAEPMIREALLDSEKGLGAEDPQVGACLALLAAVEAVHGRLDEAEKLAERAKAIHEKCFGPDHVVVADDLSGLASICLDKGDFAEAKRLLKRSLAIDDKTFGADYLGDDGKLLKLGIAHQSLGENAEAEQCYKRALSAIEKCLGPDNSSLVPILANYSILLRDTGRVNQANDMEKRARTIRAKYFKDKPVNPLPRRSAVG